MSALRRHPGWLIGAVLGFGLCSGLMVCGLLGGGLAASTLLSQAAGPQLVRPTRSPSATPPPRARIGQPAPDFTLTSLDGQPLTLSAYRGAPVALTFWATWCPGCVTEIPEVQAGAARHAASGLVWLMIDLKEDPATVQTFRDSSALTLPVLLDRDGQVGQSYRVRAIPTTYWIDAAGVVQDIYLGELNEHLIDTYVEALTQ